MTLENFEYRTDPLFLRNQFADNTDKFGIPIIPKPHFTQEELQGVRMLGFNLIKQDHGLHRNRLVHFFLYDYNFEKMWKDPAPFIELLRPYKGVLTPDFSMYTEMPPAIQLYNTFRNRWCGAYLAQKGLRVVPTVNWGTEESFDFCFAGIEKGSVVAVSTYMFHEHGNHADQKDIFLKGYRELLRRIEPEYVICYSEPFPEMEGNLIYVDYEMSSWRHMEDDIVPEESIKHTYGVLTKPPVRDIIRKTGYVCKGGGSAYGGSWKPKNKDDERFFGKPNTTKQSMDKNGELRETIYDKDGRAVKEIHHSVHKKPHKHSNPHEHNIYWMEPDNHPVVGPPINFYKSKAPILKLEYLEAGSELFMKKNVYRKPENVTYEHFSSLNDFKWCMKCNGEVEFYYYDVGYSITHPDGRINIGKFYQPDTELESDNIEEVLNYLMDDGKKLREVIKDVDVIVRTI